MTHQPTAIRPAGGKKAGAIRVFIVDDSAVVRRALTDILAADPRFEVIAAVNDPFAAAERLRHVLPDVIVLDIEMPRMDGVTFLKKLMAQHPIPVVICSSLVADKSETLLAALAAGAVEVIAKPELGVKQFLEEAAAQVREAVFAAARAKVKVIHSPPPVAPKLSADAMLPAPSGAAMLRTTEKIIAIGASTGGTEALRVLLESMPMDCPPIVIVQHMPESFTAAFAKRLDSICAITVSEARNGDRLLRGHALIAPGNKHTLLARSGAHYMVEVRDGPMVSRHRPSVDVLFRSVARFAGSNAVGIILTGMGDDGAKGMKEMRDLGASTIGQNEASCVVYGMPKEAMAAGAVEQELPLERIAAAALRLAK
ncbi:protein-glutamate methylesterase/protein-glutamine glutaminase [Stagnihabitans tardus]|uniref:Protein-glutamate methylesterase/protein-glutamine glutaminase n=1 Tax=Stagnihabitans tardus TaxID=2699202 RepID=A0AAE4YB65_9RHOB|nr:chemotaxis response regulator protein-glutamate methylesterase [Stagnihabitans tardus]NBZ86725.1 chemotaxis-specific protein-glutamate methyltransferase CheB [Stagnihabitans tardus]